MCTKVHEFLVLKLKELSESLSVCQRVTLYRGWQRDFAWRANAPKLAAWYVIETELAAWRGTGHRNVMPGAIIGDRDGDRKSWDPRAPMIWDNFSIFRANCAIRTSYIRADPRTCRGVSCGFCHVAWSNGESYEILLQIFHSDGRD